MNWDVKVVKPLIDYKIYVELEDGILNLMTKSITIQLPESIFRQFAEIAEQTQQPIETLVAQSAISNLPPPIAHAPPALQSELLQMQTLSKETLLEIAQTQINSVQYDRHVKLLTKNKEDQLNPAEREELIQMRLTADHLVLRKAYALAVLRWQGHRVPSIHEFPVPQ
jgi:hypothetical protein